MKTRFKGHETFYFRDGWLSKAMYEIQTVTNDGNALFQGTNGIAKLGLGINMVKAVKYWLQTADLLEFSRTTGYHLSEIGNSIANNDINLEDDFTLWLIHVNIVRNISQATAWSIFFNEFKAESFENQDVKDFMKAYLKKEDITVNEKSLEADINLLLNMYSKIKQGDDPEENSNCPLARLEIINKNRDGYTKVAPSIKKLDKLAILYAMVLLNNDKEGNGQISISDLEDGTNSLAAIFGINKIMINEYLEALSEANYLRLERTAGLDMVYFVKEEITAIEVISEYYGRRKQK